VRLSVNSCCCQRVLRLLTNASSCTAKSTLLLAAVVLRYSMGIFASIYTLASIVHCCYALVIDGDTKATAAVGVVATLATGTQAARRGRCTCTQEPCCAPG
jgi:hypothetical protein